MGAEPGPHSAIDSTSLPTVAPSTALWLPPEVPKLNDAPGAPGAPASPVAPVAPVAPAGPAGPDAPGFAFFLLLCFLASASPPPATAIVASAATPLRRRVKLRRVEICSRSREIPSNACAFITLFLVSEEVICPAVQPRRLPAAAHGQNCAFHIRLRQGHVAGSTGGIRR